MRVELSLEAQEHIAALPRGIQERIIKKLYFYAAQPDPLHFAKRLAGSSLFRYRIGAYRILFATANNSLFIITIVKRDKAYRDL